MLHGRQGVRMADLRDQGGRNDQRERAAVPPDGLDLDNQRPHFRRRAELERDRDGGVLFRTFAQSRRTGGNAPMQGNARRARNHVLWRKLRDRRGRSVRERDITGNVKLDGGGLVATPQITVGFNGSQLLYDDAYTGQITACLAAMIRRYNVQYKPSMRIAPEEGVNFSMADLLRDIPASGPLSIPACSGSRGRHSPLSIS